MAKLSEKQRDNLPDSKFAEKESAKERIEQAAKEYGAHLTKGPD